MVAVVLTVWSLITRNERKEEEFSWRRSNLIPRVPGFLVSGATAALGKYFINESYRIYISLHYRNHI